jgi:hypothetical protein
MISSDPKAGMSVSRAWQPSTPSISKPQVAQPKPQPNSQPVARPALNGLSAQSTWKQPTAIDASDSISNTLARGQMEADPRAQMKQFTKAGVSNGRAQQSAAAVGGASAMADARQQAAQTQLQADTTNAKQRLDFQYGSEMEAQKLSMIQQALSQSDWSVQMAQQMAAAKIQAAQQSGQLQVYNAYV